MEAPGNESQNNFGEVHHNINNVEGRKMKVVEQIMKVKIGVSKSLGIALPAKVLGGVALGAVFLTTTAMGFSPDLTEQGAKPAAKVERVERFLGQGQVGYSPEEQMEIAGISIAPVTPKFERVPGFLDQGQAGYSLEEQEEIRSGSGYQASFSRPEGPSFSADSWRFDAPFYDESVDNGGYGPLAYLDVVEDARARITSIVAENNKVVTAPSYHQQRLADRLQENRDYHQSLADFHRCNVEQGVAPSYEQQRIEDSLQERLEVLRLREASTSMAVITNSADPGSTVDQAVSRLEEKVGVLLSAAQNPSANPQQINRELDRLDYQIDMLLAAEMAGDPEAMTAVDQVIQSLEDKIDQMIAAAADDPSTNLRRLNREIDHLDYQIAVLMHEDKVW